MTIKTTENIGRLNKKEVEEALRETSRRSQVERKGWTAVQEEMEREAFLYALEQRVDPVAMFEEGKIIDVSVSDESNTEIIKEVIVAIAYNGGEYKILEKGSVSLQDKEGAFGKHAYAWASQVVFEAFLQIGQALKEKKNEETTNKA